MVCGIRKISQVNRWNYQAMNMTQVLLNQPVESDGSNKRYRSSKNNNEESRA